MPAEHAPRPVCRPRPTHRTGLLLSSLLMAAGLGACSTPSPVPTPATPPATTVTPPATPSVEPVTPSTPVTPNPPPAIEPPPPVAIDLAASTALVPVLNYADRLRTLSTTELVKEVAATGEPGNDPVRQLQLALALTYTHQPADTARAMGLLQRVINHPDPGSIPLKPLARLLVTRLQDQRRLEDTVDRQAQQLRDSQRRVELLSDRLEAMRAIERSLMPRGPAAGTNRTPAP